MKKTYAAPAVAPSGDIVRDTLSGPDARTVEKPLVSFKQIAGSVGFYL
jgi:hypothetical protein